MSWGAQSSAVPAPELAPLSAARVLVMGGISLILAGMLFGDIFAVFVLHQNADRIGVELVAATRAVAAGDANSVAAGFQKMGSLLENRGTKVDAHAHIIAFGYLALLLAVLQPHVSLAARTRKRLAGIFVRGAWLLPSGVFLIHYVGLAYSPLSSIGWGSIVADLGGLLVIVAVFGQLIGLWRGTRDANRPGNPLLADRSWSARALLAGGVLLVLAGFLHGAWYSYFNLYQHERQDKLLLAQVIEHSSANRLDSAAQAVSDYGALQAERAVHIAAHAHIIDFGLLAMLLAFIQPLVFLQEKWKRRWVGVLLAGSVILPVFVLAELKLGLFAGGIADLGGLLVIVALTAMLVGVIRYTGRLDVQRGAS